MHPPAYITIQDGLSCLKSPKTRPESRSVSGIPDRRDRTLWFFSKTGSSTIRDSPIMRHVSEKSLILFARQETTSKNDRGVRLPRFETSERRVETLRTGSPDWQQASLPRASPASEDSQLSPGLAVVSGKRGGPMVVQPAITLSLVLWLQHGFHASTILGLVQASGGKAATDIRETSPYNHPAQQGGLRHLDSRPSPQRPSHSPSPECHSLF